MDGDSKIVDALVTEARESCRDVLWVESLISALGGDVSRVRGELVPGLGGSITDTGCWPAHVSEAFFALTAEMLLITLGSIRQWLAENPRLMRL